MSLPGAIDNMIRNYVFIPTESDQIHNGKGDVFSKALRSKDPYEIKKNKFLAYMKRENEKQHPKLTKATYCVK